MKKFVIVSDSCCDLNASLREKYQVDYIPMHFSCEGKEYVADLDWGDFSVREFYDHMRNGKRFITSQVNAAQYKEYFEEKIKEGYDILYIACSSALSSSVKASYLVRDELKEKYPEAKIICIDSLNSCMGLGLMCIKASEMREEGQSIEEISSWIEENKLRFNQECTVDSLKYLKQAGRVSAMSAFFGGLLSVKPIIISDVNGNNAAVEKVKGKANSINRVVERCVNAYTGEYKQIYAVHADCEEDLNIFVAQLKEKLPEDVIINTGYIGPIIGASAGPGTIAVYFFGKKVVFDSKKS